MSGTAVFRYAARALRPTTTTATRFRRTLVGNRKERPFSPAGIVAPRRYYSAGGGGVNMGKGLNNRPAKIVVPKDHVFLTLEEFAKPFDKRNLLMQQLLEEKFKYDRLKRLLVRVPIFVGIAYWVRTRYFSDGGEEEAKNNMTESD